MQKYLIMLVILVGVACSLTAATFPGSISRDPLIRGNISDRLSVGAEYDRIERSIEWNNGGTDILSADSVAGYIGYDALPWLTTYVTLGATSLRSDRWGDSDYALRFSLGANAYIWEADVLVPAFAAGRISVKASGEFARHASDSGFGTSDWVEFVAAIPVGYEIFDRYPANKSGLSTSLNVYAGPAVSFLSGDLTASPATSRGFEQDQPLGVIVGADVYFAPTISIGVKTLIFEETTTGASVRFRF